MFLISTVVEDLLNRMHNESRVSRNVANPHVSLQFGKRTVLVCLAGKPCMLSKLVRFPWRVRWAGRRKRGNIGFPWVHIYKGHVKLHTSCQRAVGRASFRKQHFPIKKKMN